jgi:hypothetical protein
MRHFEPVPIIARNVHRGTTVISTESHQKFATFQPSSGSIDSLFQAVLKAVKSADRDISVKDCESIFCVLYQSRSFLGTIMNIYTLW